MWWRRLLAWLGGECHCWMCPDCRHTVMQADGDIERLTAALAAVKGERDEWRRRALGVEGERR